MYVCVYEDGNIGIRSLPINALEFREPAVMYVEKS